jgi:hypothetical protein
MRVSASEQVQVWLKGLTPDTKRRVRAALKGLEGTGHSLDIKALRGELEGFYRLRAVITGSFIITGRVQPFIWTTLMSATKSMRLLNGCGLCVSQKKDSAATSARITRVSVIAHLELGTSNLCLHNAAHV